jgi:hypothetical protein
MKEDTQGKLPIAKILPKEAVELLLWASSLTDPKEKAAALDSADKDIRRRFPKYFRKDNDY